MFSFVLSVQSLKEDNVCSLLSLYPDACASTFGCGFCAETSRCVPVHDSIAESCPESNSLVQSNSKKLGRCFSLYSEDGCASCVSREAGIACGWCQSLGVCVEGSKEGPYGITCPAEDWLYNKTKCDRSTCAAAKTQKQCRNPCRWSSRRQLCTMKRNLAENSAAEAESTSTISRSKIILGVSVVAVFSICVLAVVGIARLVSRPMYQSLPLMKTDFSLDEVPPSM